MPASSMSSESFTSFTASRLDCHEVNPLSGKPVDVATRPLRRARPLCHECHQRPALARIRGRWLVLKDHDVCRQCWRAWMDARRAQRAPRAPRFAHERAPTTSNVSPAPPQGARLHPMRTQHPSTNPHLTIPTLTAEAWRCRSCSALLGLEERGELHVKYREFQQWITGRCRHICRRCGAMNTLHTAPTSPAPRPAREQGGAR